MEQMEPYEIYDPAGDERFKNPVIDIDRWEQRPCGVKFRFVHGKFEGTNVKFSFCFPEKSKFKGRFYQHLSPFPGPDEEMASFAREGTDDMIAFALLHGAYFVESNMGSNAAFGSNPNPQMLYQSSAAVAEYSRVVAREIYGCGRPFGYVYGGSGGGYKTMGCIENTSAFDGAVPFVIGCPAALPNVISVRGHGLRELRHKMDSIIDAVEPGSDHGMFDGLDAHEAAALKEVTAMGYPPEAWLLSGLMGDGSLPVLAPGIKRMDPEYFKDFWTKPGYYGTEPGNTAVRDRICMHSTVKAFFLQGKDFNNAIQGIPDDVEVDGRNGVNDAWQKMLSESAASEKPWVLLEDELETDDPYESGLTLTFESGDAAGAVLSVGGLDGKRLVIGATYGTDKVEDVLSKVRPGDQVFLDNSDYIAIQTYHRHQVPSADFKVWDQFRDQDGNPLYPQRSYLSSTGFAYSAAGSIQSGNIQGKVIVVASLADESAFPWMADWYRQKVYSVYKDDTDNRFRLWYMEHCYHGSEEHTADPLHVASYGGALYQALLDVADWVEQDKIPPRTTGYTVEDGQVHIPSTAKERRGLQPVVHVTINGEKRAQVHTGEKVTLKAQVEVPEGGGVVCEAQWNFTGDPQQWEDAQIMISEDGTQAEICKEWCCERPGTNFVTLRVKAGRRRDDLFTHVVNMDRVRIEGMVN